MQVHERETISAPCSDKPISSRLDAPVFSLINLNWEVTLYLALIFIAGLMRFWDLGSRALHHDESLHALYSWYLYNGMGYTHDPMMHGPFQFHFNSLIYFLFGVGDYTARITYALFGTVLVGLPYFLRRHLGRSGALVCAVLLTFSPSMLYYSRFARNDILIVVWTMALVTAAWRYLDEKKPAYLYIGAATLSLSFATKETTFITAAIFGSLLVLTIAAKLLLRRETAGLAARLRQEWAKPPVALAVLLATLSLPQGGAFARVLWERLAYLPDTQTPMTIFGFRLAPENVAAGIVVTVLIGLMAAVGLAWHRRQWVISAVIFYGIFILLFTTFFTNPAGFGSGIWGSLDYWLAQQGFRRGGQPGYYYLIILPIYEFLPVLFGLIGIVYYAIRRSLFSFFLIYWAALALLAFSVAGEKMPWLVVHIALPFILLAGKFIGEIIDRVDWRAFWHRGGVYFLLLVAACILAAAAIIASLFQANAGASPGDFVRTFVVALLLAALIVYAWRQGTALGWGSALRPAGLLVAGVLLVFTVRAAWQVSYYHGDIPVEMLVYTQSSPEIPRIMKEIDALDHKLGGKKELKISVDSTSSFTWPWAWYLRDYKNVDYTALANLSAPPTSEVVLLHASNVSAAQPYLTDYSPGRRFPHRWWFPEDYRDLTWPRFWQEVTNPTNWKQWWDYFMYRQLASPLGSEDAVYYVRKDLLVDEPVAASPPQTLANVQSKQMTLPAIASFGSKGNGPAQFNEPRGIAIDQLGNIYVADSLNHRVEKLSCTGQLLASIGGQIGTGDGQFYEPWGLAVDAVGFVYVADTWNHRIQKLDSDLKFVAKWGENAESGLDPRANAGKFYGPRGIAVAPDGTLYVTDTGNKRVQHFDADGRFLGVFGGPGSGEGQFSEPVGIAIDDTGNIYVADTWNRRVQKFDAQFHFIAQYPVPGWESVGILDKPYLAVGQDGSFFVTDPENSRLLQFGANGDLLATINRLGSDKTSFNLPIGIAVDASGSLYVADSKNNRIQKFEAVR